MMTKKVILPRRFGDVIHAFDKENGLPVAQKSFGLYYAKLNELAEQANGQPQSLLKVISSFRDHLREALKAHPLTSKSPYDLSSHLASHLWLLGKIG